MVLACSIWLLKKLAEVLHIHFALGGVSHGDEAVQLHGCRFRGALYGADYVAEFAYAGRFDDHAVGMELLDDIVQRRAEIAHQGAADAPGIHFGNVDAGVLQKAAVNADFAELVFDQHHLLAFVGLFQQLFDQRGFTCAQKAGNNIDFVILRSLLFAKIIICRGRETTPPFHFTLYCSRLGKNASTGAKIALEPDATSMQDF